jgi:hypothetical protein
MVGVYLFGETMGRISRDLFRGRDIEDIYTDFESDPENWIGRQMLNFPLLGMYTPTARAAWDAITEDERRQQSSTIGGAGISAFDSLNNLIMDTTHSISPAASDTGNFDIHAQRYAARLIPGYRSYWFMLLSYGLNSATGFNVGEAIEQPGGRRYRRPDVPMHTPRQLRETLPGDTNVFTDFTLPPDIPTDTFDFEE